MKRNERDLRRFAKEHGLRVENGRHHLFLYLGARLVGRCSRAECSPAHLSNLQRQLTKEA
jgi:hypothetical protein